MAQLTKEIILNMMAYIGRAIDKAKGINQWYIAAESRTDNNKMNGTVTITREGAGFTPLTLYFSNDTPEGCKLMDSLLRYMMEETAQDIADTLNAAMQEKDATPMPSKESVASPPESGATNIPFFP